MPSNDETKIRCIGGPFDGKFMDLLRTEHWNGYWLYKSEWHGDPFIWIWHKLIGK